jgi:hypothetical protein
MKSVYAESTLFLPVSYRNISLVETIKAKRDQDKSCATKTLVQAFLSLVKRRQENLQSLHNTPCKELVTART